MKKLLLLISIVGILFTGLVSLASVDDTLKLDSIKNSTKESIEQVMLEDDSEDAVIEKSNHQLILEWFTVGDWKFMAPILIVLMIGIALSIERIIYLFMATTNSKKLLNDIEETVTSGGVEDAKELCRNTSGPIASIFYQGLDRIDEGIENVEKSIVAYGGVQMGKLEKGLSWISLFIALAPMLGFFGTVIGMYQTFADIEAAAGKADMTVIASGMKIALLTTVFGLVVGMILQVFYNFIVSKIDGIVNEMEEASITIVDILYKQKIVK